MGYQKGYKVIGKISDKEVKKMFEYQEVEDSISNNTKSKRIAKGLIIGALALSSIVLFGNDGFAATNAYSQPKELGPIFEYIDWLILMCRIIVSSVLGLIATYAGYKWGTDLSSSGVSTAKKILKNCAIGMIIVQFGALAANFFTDKLQSFIL